MPSCLPSRHHVLRTILSPRDLRLPVLHDTRRAKQSRLFVAGSGRRWNASSCTRAHSSDVQTSNNLLGQKASSTKHELSALLHRISAFLPCALPRSDGGIQSYQFWTELLSEVDVDLCYTSEAHPSARVVGESSVRHLYILVSDNVTSLQYAELTSGLALMSSSQLSSKIRLRLTRLTATSYETGGKTSLRTLRSSASCLCSMSQQDA
jgi:hypothetical protein